ncbi:MULTISPECIES: sensor domain-containing diguanylate cyclase [unclassified Sphingomonas]|uniref:sensor domain-containing diguanylate cyclase n=1 Tax=unclassified Sphingomonas TaxID=196159 RepID=UPI0007004BF3|nr:MULTISPECIES: sensor domain-containing diguanylate cyclase [unclassified Sphingomonas]KQX20307.1 diguanylate cyclase [Sphingomonas sp. Root1294]KQY67557.1 diguanylate cyclase [Sphingomonas sp. Root50]KRB90934.1 diguanylate cyclase [Sphingomonas sp. Root720]
MRIATITNWAYGITLLLTFGSGAAFMAAVRADDQERFAVERRSDYIRIAEDIELIVERMTDQARLYAMRGEARHKAKWLSDRDGTSIAERALVKLAALPILGAERQTLRAAEGDMERIAAIETAAIAAVDRGDRASAQALLYGNDYLALDAALDQSLNRFKSEMSERAGQTLAAARARADRWDDVARTMLALTGILFLAVLYFILSKRVARPLAHMSDVVTRMADRDFEADLPDDRHSDEIGDVTRALRLFRRNSIERERLERERDEDRRIKDLVARMMHRMQGCDVEAELADVVACYAPQIFPDLAGHIFVYDHARGRLATIGRWLEPALSVTDFAPSFCWGLRRGHSHRSNAAGEDICCQHIGDIDGQDCLCVPLMAQGGTVGMLYFEAQRGDGRYAERDIYIDLMSENIGLALANIQLRATLGALATRDPLTGLSNRRHLDEVLNVERALAESAGTPLACLMIDIDHFKRFNDQFGHDAGDLVMQHVAQVLKSQTHDRDLPCRYGGEEFAILLPTRDSAAAAQRAEQIRQTIRKVALAYHGRSLPPVTVSIGVAAYPMETDGASLLSVADGALLAAKEAGRDRVVIAGSGTPGPTTLVGAAD